MINIAANMESKMPKLKVRANPFIKLVPSQNRITATIKVVKFPSLIDGHALRKLSSTDWEKLLPDLNSSLNLEKIKMLASMAIPIERIKPPMPAKVRVTGINLKRDKTKAIYIPRVKADKIPGSL